MMEATLMQEGGGQFQPRRGSVSQSENTGVEIRLSVAIVAVKADEPRVLIVKNDSSGDDHIGALPSGAFSPFEHGSLAASLRNWVLSQTGLSLGYAEQLSTHVDRSALVENENPDARAISIGYLALARATPEAELRSGEWKSWYDYLPWEDWRHGRPDVIASVIEPSLRQWAMRTPSSATSTPSTGRLDHARMAFGLDSAAWDEEKALERYELLFEAGLIDEAHRNGRETQPGQLAGLPELGLPLLHNNRRTLATAVGRVRTKLKYRPVIFELVDDEFTLFELQKTVEAILGPHLHKQNFRRLVESAGLVELTGEVRAKTGGRPAKLYRFRREVLLERPAPGVRIKPGRM